MKPEKELVRIGKFLSLVLRHKPEEAKLTLDQHGWADVALLLKNCSITKEELDWIVENNSKKRYSYNEDQTKIKANQGHSLSEVEVELEEVKEAPDFLYHGTASELFSVLLNEGIKKMSRNHVHLSIDIPTAIQVGKRKSNEIVILQVNAKKMQADGQQLFRSANGVYLTEYVSPQYLSSTPL